MTPDVDAILDHVNSHLAHPEFRARLLGLLARAGLYQAPRAHLIHYRAEAAERMLASGLYRSQVRQALQERFGVSRRSAYRLIQRALDARQTRLFR